MTFRPNDVKSHYSYSNHELLPDVNSDHGRCTMFRKLAHIGTRSVNHS